jgi:hypothetical protein
MKDDSKPVRIKRIKNHESGYTILDNRVLENSKLSYAARGLWASLMCKPDTWIVRPADLAKRGDLAAGSIYKKLRELRDHGYAALLQPRNQNGRLGGAYWEIYEVPYKIQPDPPKQDMDKQDEDEPDSVISEDSNTSVLEINQSINKTTTTSGCGCDELIIPDSLQSQKKQATKALHEALEEDRESILYQVDDLVKKGLRGERKQIDSPLHYLISLCKHSKDGTYISMPRSATHQDTSMKELASLELHHRDISGDLHSLEMMIKNGGPEADRLLQQSNQRRIEIHDIELQIKSLREKQGI